jgi:hypothetical protein
MKYLLRSLLMLGVLTSSTLSAQPLLLESGGMKTVLVELYTSEGCNSCPPAERFLNRFTTNDELWNRYVPVAFHVDYWNDLGWVDRFSQPAYASRQRLYARQQQRNTVYTPAFMVNGEPWRPGWYNKAIETPQVMSGQLSLSIDQGRIEARYQPAPGQGSNLMLNVALLGMGLESEITAGENSGKQAHHEFVVLAHRQQVSSDARWQLPMPNVARSAAPGYALAAWVSRSDDLTPLQAVGGWLPVERIAD